MNSAHISGLSFVTPKSDSNIYHYTLQMLKFYSSQINLDELAEKLKIKNKSKLHRRRTKWDKLEGKIPTDYFSALGISNDVLNTVIEMDSEHYYNLLKKIKPLYSQALAVVRPVLLKLVFDKELSETEAIELCQEIMNKPDCSYRQIILEYLPFRRIIISSRGHSLQDLDPGYNVKDGFMSFNFLSTAGVKLK